MIVLGELDVGVLTLPRGRKRDNLTIATRNTRDFKKAGVKTLNPFE